MSSEVSRKYNAKLNPNDVAKACVRAAEVNHYLVGLAYNIPKTVAEKAQQVLYGWENKGEISEEVADLALHVLAQASGVSSR